MAVMARPNLDHEHLGALQDYFAQQRFLPSYSKISELLGFRAKNAAFALVARLRLAGYIRLLPDKRLMPTSRFFERPLAQGKVAAGFPSPASDDLQDSLSIDEHLVRHPSRTVLVTVKGESMIGAGILPGDMAVVEKRHTASAGDIVVAIVDNEFTIKRLARERGRFVLKPENPAFEVMRPAELEIFGVVVGTVRKY
jgi:SOS regulatory protein LexA